MKRELDIINRRITWKEEEKEKLEGEIVVVVNVYIYACVCVCVVSSILFKIILANGRLGFIQPISISLVELAAV